MLKEQIASGLENALSQQGFVEPSVSDLQNASGVSLRTLYRHFPSKEAMVIGALEHRHARYLDFLADCAHYRESMPSLICLNALRGGWKPRRPTAVCR